jgi:alanyl-tRNA synthetase
MVQFKKIFVGQEKRSYSCAATAQKCLRVGGKHNDLENVGYTSRHHTFFEMLGNFSFGDYFKEEAIQFAWTYLTHELQLPQEHLYVTVFKDDDEAITLWKKVTGIPSDRIYRLGEKDNFWTMGDTGPCGPCSEILFDQGEQMACGPQCGIGVCDCDRYLEIWNMVFMQFDRDETGQMKPLPSPSIDTGMGLERIAAVCQGVYSNYDTDLFTGLIESTAYKTKVEYGSDPEIDTALRVVADHSRAVAFMIVDGILPSNEGRGYVLRRLIRRAYRFGRFLGLDRPFLHEVCDQLVGEMGAAYPELLKTREFMTKVVSREEDNFSKTLDKGLTMLSEELEDLEQRKLTEVSGETVFKLYDTFGFPVDIVKDVAEKRGLHVDEEGFNRFMQEQKNRSKFVSNTCPSIDFKGKLSSYQDAERQTEFVGYEHLQASSRIVDLLDQDGQSLTEMHKGDKGYVITARTPFYGESGGQTGDIGQILSSTGQAQVKDTFLPLSGLIIHRTEIRTGELSRDQEVNLSVDEEARMAAARNHTSTHLLHAALRNILGEHVKQSGSFVSPDRLRFDFTHIHPVSEEELRMIEDEVNAAILSDHPVMTRVVPYKQAMEEEALGLFEEKYSDEVRVVEIPDVSKELCGGTHLSSTGQVGAFVVISETGVAAGIRRIEAATGWQSLALYRQHKEMLTHACGLVNTRPEGLSVKIQELQEQAKRLEKEKQQLAAKIQFSAKRNILDEVEDISGIPVLATQVDVPDGSGMKGLRNMMDELRSQFQSGVILLIAQHEDKVVMVLFVSQDLFDRFTAPDLISPVAREINGSGGGRPDLAQAGGSDPSGIDAAINKLKELIVSGC